MLTCRPCLYTLAKLCTFGLLCNPKRFQSWVRRGRGSSNFFRLCFHRCCFCCCWSRQRNLGHAGSSAALACWLERTGTAAVGWRGNRQPSQVTSHQGFVSPPMHARNSHPTQALSPEPLKNPNFGTSLSGRALQLVVHNGDIPGALSLKPCVQLCSKINT